MSKYNPQALEGYLLCLQSQRKTAETAYTFLPDLAGESNWSLEDVQAFYDKILCGDYILHEENAVKGFIFCLHRQGSPLKTAHAKINRLKRDVKFEEVKSVYTKIDAKEYDMKELDPKLLLENMPDPAKDVIAKYMDLKSRLTLRKQCKKFRSIIDNGHFTLEELNISVLSGGFNICSDRGFDVFYCQRSDGCELRDGKRWRKFTNPFSDSSLYKVMCEAELKVILGSNKNQKILKLEVSAEERRELEITSVMESALKSCETKPKVRMLQGFNIRFYDVLPILGYLDPSEIKDLKILHCYYDVSYPPDVQTVHNKIFELEQWKKLETFSYGEDVYCMNLADAFSHFKYASFDLKDAPSNEHVMQLKERILKKNQDLDEIQIHISLTKQNRNEFRNGLQTVSAFQTRNHWEAEHKAPAPGRKTLSVCIKNKMIWFKGPAYAQKKRRIKTYGDSREPDTEEERWFHFYY